MIFRNITPALMDALADSPIVLLSGARQTGKSFLTQWLASSIHPAQYLTLDDVGVLSAVSSDPAGFLAGLSGPVVLDEVQRAPELFRALKLEVDRDRRPGRFLLTGSADVLLLPRLSESLAGRMEILTLWPLSQGEIKGVSEGFIDAVFAEKLDGSSTASEGRSPLLRRILRGGYPEIQRRTAVRRQQAWFNSYVTTILQRDVRDLANIEGLTAMPRLLSLLATRISGLISFAELSRSSAIPQSTLKRYIALLETTFLVQPLPAWSGNPSKRLVKAPKLVLNDTGLVAHLLGMGLMDGEGHPEQIGPLLENFVVMELRKQAAWSARQVRLFHFRTPAGREVDIVIEDAAGRVAGIEVKAAATVRSDDFKGLRALAEESGEHFCRGVVLYTGTESIPFGPCLHALPVEALWTLNAQDSPSF